MPGKLTGKLHGKFQSIRGLLIDLSGVLHDGPEAIPGSVEALQKLRQAGMPLRFVSNTSRMTRADLQTQLQAIGFDIEMDEILTAPRAARNWLQQNRRKTLLLVHPDLEPEFAGLDITQVHDDADAVLVGDAADGFNYARLNLAFRALQSGAELLAIAKNRYFREGAELSLDAGPFVIALEFAATCEARLFGKPDRNFFQAAIDDMELPADAVMMIGDDVESDVNGALAAGLKAALVSTGKFTKGDESRTQTACFADLADVVAAITAGSS